jgi:DNA topoisomerase IA
MQEGKAQKRLWLPDQTPETVIAALADLGDAANYDNLAGEGFARTYIDWLYGVNLTRYATLKCGSLMRVGRVIVPIVRAIYERDMAIKNFVPGKYCVIASKEKTNGEVVELVGKTKFKPEEYFKAEQLCAAYNAADAVVTSVKRKKDTIMPGKLYSLSKLQSTLAKKYKMPMKDSLEIVQRLYEQGYLTYPRTNSEYMATAEKDKVKKILGGIAKLGYPVTFKDSKKIFDDSKIESHSAITPTYKIPEKGRLSEAENQVYLFHVKDDGSVEKVEYTLKNGVVTFIANGFSYYVFADMSDVMLYTPYGDLDADGYINAKDALMVLKLAVNKLEMTDELFARGDVNFDESVNAKDALEILKFAVGKPSVLDDIYGAGE